MGRLAEPAEIKNILAKHGFHFSKSLGQNFLINDSVCPEMAEQCGADKDTGVLEVGPGIGVLTQELSRVSKKVVAVELDRRLLPVLEETLEDCGNVNVISGDILKLDLKRLTEEQFGREAFCVCANLPYYITSPVIMRFLESGLPVKAITVMVQKEAAERLCAPPGTRACGAVSVGVHYRAVPEILFQVGRGSFLPAPKVDSAVIRLTMRKAPPVKVENEAFFFTLARGSFGQRRKMAINSISAALHLPKQEVEAAFKQAGLDLKLRAEQIDLNGFAVLSNILAKNG